MGRSCFAGLPGTPAQALTRQEVWAPAKIPKDDPSLTQGSPSGQNGTKKSWELAAVVKDGRSIRLPETTLELDAAQGM